MWAIMWDFFGEEIAILRGFGEEGNCSLEEARVLLRKEEEEVWVLFEEMGGLSICLIPQIIC